MKKTKISETVSVSDSKIRGVVVIKRQDGSIVLKKENAIVQNGRRFIRDKFIASGIAALSDFESDLTAYSLDKIAFGSSDVATEYDMESLVSPEALSELTISEVTGAAQADEGTMFIKFSASMDRTALSTGYTVREIGLVLTAEGEDDLLFSRAVFDPITVAAGEIYQVDYYIYF
jgi:hypothetical protein